MIAEPCEGGILLKLAVALPVEHYSPERQAEFILSNAVDADDYKAACKAVERMGLNPSDIPHHKPKGTD